LAHKPLSCYPHCEPEGAPIDVDLASIAGSTISLFALGSCGAMIFKVLAFPVPGLLGTIAMGGTLRIAGVALPCAPAFLSIIVPTCLGLSARRGR